MGLDSRATAWFGLAIVALLTPTAAAAAPDEIPAWLAARNEGDYPRAIALLEAESRLKPDDTTVLRLLGTTYAFAGQYPDAIRTLTRAHALARRDSDITLALARAYLWSGDYQAARATAEEILATEPANTELPTLLQAIDRARAGVSGASPRPLVGITQSVSQVSVGGTDRTWSETIAVLAFPVARHATLAGEINREDRAGTVDTRLQLRLDRRFGKGGWAYLALAGTPDANFRERWSIRGGGNVPVVRLLSLVFDLRYADYGSTTIFVVEPGARLQTRDNRFALTVTSINLWGEARQHQNGWSLRAEAQPYGAVRFFAGAATYPDTEAGITRQVRSAFGGASIPIGDRVVLRLTFDHESRAFSYTRNSAIFGASWRF